jgi:carbon monoxide dehydrogenase subunit G
MNHSGTFFATASADRAFNVLANPEHFAPQFPDFESMVIQDETHFAIRIAITVGQISGHVNLAMELAEAERPAIVAYRGQGMVAGSSLTFAMQFRISPIEDTSEVNWRGEIAVDGMLALMAGGMIEEMGRRNLELMAERLQNRLREDVSVGRDFPIEP